MSFPKLFDEDMRGRISKGGFPDESFAQEETGVPANVAHKIHDTQTIFKQEMLCLFKQGLWFAFMSYLRIKSK
ncbi:hypothetical protein UR09_05000 [Candidatus Nitromaritima sp. SCGC AAA799-A02]|nr:hypothetical protein UR09_05000 [Candidatus Nitromaritima sp. SCGC AAA799-A02]